jgi:hypothetical protein
MPAAGRFCNERTYYEAGLRRRGSLTLWIEDTALQRWQTCGPGGQSRYADAVIQKRLMLHRVQTAVAADRGLLTSILTLMDLTIAAPDHTTVNRRAVTLPGERPVHRFGVHAGETRPPRRR